MIFPVSITIQTAGDVVYPITPQLYFYKGLMKFIKDLSCFQTGSLCKDCTDCRMCRFFKLSGNNFTAYPGLLFQMNLFEKQSWNAGELLEINCFLIGSCLEDKEFITLYFSNLTQIFQTEIRAEIEFLPLLSPVLVTTERIQLLTMIDQDDFAEVWNQMSAYYNDNYGCSLPLIPGTFQEKEKAVTINSFPVSVIGHKRYPHGFVNTYTFKYPVLLERNLLKVGIGKWNWIGGGRCALKNRTDI